MRASFKTLLAAALLFGGTTAIQPSTASAQSYSSHPSLAGPIEAYAQYRRGAYPRIRASRHYGGYHRYGYRPAYYGYRRYGYRPAYYGYRRYGYRPYYYHRGYSGGAVAAGIIGGLALGAVANPYYYRPSYYRPAYYGHRCVLERRRVVNRYGHRVWRRIRVCY